MRHVSIPVGPREFINVVPLNPLLSKCQVKVMYIGDGPNRNRSIITKDVAKKMAKSLPGSPIVGKYNTEERDFEEHNRVIKINSKGVDAVPDTFPYGFVPTDAKIWFEKFLDDGINEREYLVTEAILWTGQFPEAQRIIDKGNNHSMELSDKDEHLDAHWTRSENGDLEFFIINDAVFSKLCVLGEEFEPCFEGSQIGKLDFNFGEDFKSTFFSMIEQFKNLYEGGPNMQDDNNTTLEDEVVEIDNSNIEEVVEDVVEDNLSEEVEGNAAEAENKAEGAVEEPAAEDTVESIPEYIELKESYDTLKTQFDDLQEEFSTMKTNYAVLEKFKLDAESAEKDKLIESFYMLSDEDKKPVVDNKDQYSLVEIEEKLSVICVRNKVDFSLNKEDKEEDADSAVHTYNMDNLNVDSGVPAWIKAVEATASKNLY